MSYPEFPRFAPVSRSVQMGNYSASKKRCMNGRTFSLVYGDRKTGDRVNLQFRLDREDALAILDHFERVDGTYGVFKVFQPSDGSSGVFAGMKFKNGLPTEILSEEGATGRYRYADPPQISQLHKNLFEVQVELVQTYAQSPE